MKYINIKLNNGELIYGEVIDEDDSSMSCVDQNGLDFTVEVYVED